MMFSVLFLLFFFFNDTATTEIYTLSLHDALPIYSFLSRDTRITGGSSSEISGPKVGSATLSRVFIMASSLLSTARLTASAATTTTSTATSTAAKDAASTASASATCRSRRRQRAACLAIRHLLARLQAGKHLGIRAIRQAGKDHPGRQLPVLHLHHEAGRPRRRPRLLDGCCQQG